MQGFQWGGGVPHRVPPLEHITWGHHICEQYPQPGVTCVGAVLTQSRRAGAAEAEVKGGILGPVVLQQNGAGVACIPPP